MEVKHVLLVILPVTFLVNLGLLCDSKGCLQCKIATEFILKSTNPHACGASCVNPLDREIVTSSSIFGIVKSCESCSVNFEINSINSVNVCQCVQPTTGNARFQTYSAADGHQCLECTSGVVNSLKDACLSNCPDFSGIIGSALMLCQDCPISDCKIIFNKAKHVLSVLTNVMYAISPHLTNIYSDWILHLIPA